MIKETFLTTIQAEIDDLKKNGLYKNEYEIVTSQSADIEIFHQGLKKHVNL
jgi:hypothetical protein